MHGRKHNGLLNHAILLLIFPIVGSTASSRRDIETLRHYSSCPVPVSIYAVAQYVGFDPGCAQPQARLFYRHPVPLRGDLGAHRAVRLAFFVTETGAFKRDAAAMLPFWRRHLTLSWGLGGACSCDRESWWQCLQRDRAEAEEIVVHEMISGSGGRLSPCSDWPAAGWSAGSPHD
jgi:hypothetical protein